MISFPVISFAFMKRNKMAAFAIFYLFTYIIAADMHSPSLSPHIAEKIRCEIDTISSWVTLPVIVNAVKEQNAENLSMETLHKRDSIWIEITESNGAPNDLMKQLQNNKTGRWLKNLRKKSIGKYRECFLCDNKGALVAVSDITSDYFQGDESKWIDCFNNGLGKAIYALPAYDKSADAVLIQISVPVKEAGETIGVLVVGVKLSTLRYN